MATNLPSRFSAASTPGAAEPGGGFPVPGSPFGAAACDLTEIRTAPGGAFSMVYEGVAYPTGSGLACTLLACWEAGHDQPWLILTDLPASDAHPTWYAWRMWIERGFRAVKRGCWQWHKTQMREPIRVARPWAVVAVATVYTVEVGGEVGPAQPPPVGGPRSRLRRGLLRVWVALLNRESMPQGVIQHHDWPKPATTANTLLEPYVYEG